MAQIDLGIILRAFGYPNAEFNPEFDRVPSKIGSPARVEEGTVAASPYYAPNKLTGGEYFLPVTITYTETTETGQTSSVTAVANGELMMGEPLGDSFSLEKQIELPFPLVSVTSRKRIIDTPLTERGGTVKELISTEGYDIQIRGIMIGKQGQFPEADMIALQRLYEVQAPVKVANVITDIFLGGQQNYAVITRIAFPEKRGVPGVREYEMTLASDLVFSLEDIG